ncbi:MAG: SCO family protein [Gallionellaceae bacterium]|nr:SCO family protein [Gallionellaceae bacterium]
MKIIFFFLNFLLVLHSSLVHAEWLNGELPPFQKKISFSLIDQGQQAFSSQQLEGRYSLIFFGYSTCSDICPTSLQMAARVKKSLMASEPINVVFITLDPVHDTSEKLADYLAGFDQDFIGLTGSQKEINNTASSFLVKYRKRTIKGKVNDVFDHSGTSYLLDKSGKLLLSYPYATPPEKIIADITYLYKNGKNWISGRMSGAPHAEAHQ